jgi:tRNA(adenine34) deaminase
MINTLEIHRNFMFKAYLEAEKAFEADEVPVGAVIVKDGVIVGRGHNLTEQLSDPTAHAEIMAITAACDSLKTNYLSGCTMYVTLEPCPMCAGALVWSKIDRVVFAATDEKAGGCGSVFNIAENKQLNHQIEVIQGVMELDCSELLKSYFAKKRL